MMIEINADKNVDNREALIPWVEGEVSEGLSRFAEHLTRVQVHLHDESAGRPTGADQRCMLEARPAGREPVAVTNHGESMHQAVVGAVTRMQSLLTSEFARTSGRHAGATTIGDHLPEG